MVWVLGGRGGGFVGRKAIERSYKLLTMLSSLLRT